VREDDPQRTQEWTAPPEDVEQGEVAAGATAEDAKAAAAAREAAAQAERSGAVARAAEIKAEVDEAAVRRAEEETAKAEEAVQAAEKKEEKLSRKERKAKERAEQAEAEAEQARRQAEESARLKASTTAKAPKAPKALSGANVTSPGLGADTDPAAAASAASYRAGESEHDAAPGPLDRPEVVAGIVFGSAFLLARILKRLVD
jgi:hypothetical protein